MSRIHQLQREHRSFEAVWSTRRGFDFVRPDVVHNNDVLHLFEISEDGKPSGRNLLALVTWVEDGVASIKLLARLKKEDGDASLTPYTQPKASR